MSSRDKATILPALGPSICATVVSAGESQSFKVHGNPTVYFTKAPEFFCSEANLSYKVHSASSSSKTKELEASFCKKGQHPSICGYKSVESALELPNIS